MVFSKIISPLFSGLEIDLGTVLNTKENELKGQLRNFQYCNI